MAEDNLENESGSPLEPASQPSEQDPEEESLIPSEILDSIPQESRRQFTRAFSSITQLARPIVNPVLGRITSEHITQMISNVEARSNRDADAEKSNRRYQFLYFIVALAALLFLMTFFTIREQYHLLASVVTGAMGFGSGFGIGKLTSRR